MVIGEILFLLATGIHLVLIRWGRNVALHLFDFLDNFKLSRGMENVSRPSQKQLQVLGDISSSNVDSLDCVIDRKALENWTTMANAVTTIQDEAGSLTSGVQTQDSLLLEENLRDAELLEENVGSLCAVIVRVERWVCEQNGMLFGRNLELIKNMAPKCFHIIPVGDDTVFNWVIKFEDSAIFVSRCSDELFLLVLCDHHLLVHGSSNIRVELQSGFRVACNTSLHDTGSVIDNNWRFDNVYIAFS